MKELFRMDRKNYNPDGKVYRRPSSRAIILKDGKVLLNYIAKFGCYEFPGGGSCSSPEGGRGWRDGAAAAGLGEICINP